MKRIINYLNPIARLGKRKYSTFFPLVTIVLVTLLTEFFVNVIIKNPNAIGIYAIFLYIGLIIYFSFRDGLKGGFIAVGTTILYYFYIIYSRHYRGQQYQAGIDTIITLGIVYMILAGIIGWLKERIDTLLERETDERRRLQAIVQQLPVGVLVSDNSGAIVQANKKVDEILGIKVPIGFLIGQDKVLVPSQQEGHKTSASHGPLAQVLSTGRAVVNREYSLKKPGGKKVYVQVSASAIHNRTGKVIAAASIITDVTQQRELEIRKDDFVNMASHELKTPITSMKLYTDLLLKRLGQVGDEGSLKMLQSIKNQTEKLQDLVNDLLDVSRLQTGKLSFKKEVFILNDLIGETIDSLQGSGEQRILFTKSKPVSVVADHFRIYQVITNLVTNAMKYSPEEKKIIVKVGEKDGKAIVSVQDAGIGISKEQQKMIFDKLYQVTDAKEKTFPGLGMGLYISKEIVKRHRGSIWVESEKDKGSTFSFSLPLDQKN